MNRRVRSLTFLTVMAVIALLLLRGKVERPALGERSPGGVSQEQPALDGSKVAEPPAPRPLPLPEPAREISALHEPHREIDRGAPRDSLAPSSPVEARRPRERSRFPYELGAPLVGAPVAAFAGPAGRMPLVTPHPSSPPRLQLQCGASLAAALPNPVTASLDCRMGQLGFSVGGGLFSRRFEISSLDARARFDASNLEARLRWYPFGHGLFLGGALGYQSLYAKAEKDVEVDMGLWTETVTATVTLQTRRFYATPHLGWEVTFARHATLGLEVGALVPIAPRTSVDVSLDSHGGFTELAVGLADLFGMDDLAEDKIKRIGRYPLPYVAVRAGWTF